MGTRGLSILSINSIFSLPKPFRGRLSLVRFLLDFSVDGERWQSDGYGPVGYHDAATENSSGSADILEKPIHQVPLEPGCQARIFILRANGEPLLIMMQTAEVIGATPSHLRPFQALRSELFLHEGQLPDQRARVFKA